MLKILISLVSLLCLSACATLRYSPLEHQIAQKIMLDVRYFCDKPMPNNKPCTQPVTKLPNELRALIQEAGIGGVILFAENLADTPQMIKLNQDLQASALAGGHPPLFIAIDQEGGRVMRLPSGLGTAFPGNMALGASYHEAGTDFARQSAEVIAKEISVLGFNVNFAPTVDVNINPNNPVINVRSYSQDPKVAAALGMAQMEGMQSQGVLSALKHFPGHGDTSVDSHVGLPRVEHDRATIDRVDLYPFKHAIAHGNPAMIMTAHIQYPMLDNSVFTTKEGVQTIIPATMSPKILRGILREELNYQGLIVTDALNMAGISHFYTPEDALIQTFKAGADIALMPFSIRYPDDICSFRKMLSTAASAYANGHIERADLQTSLQRIQHAKANLNYFQGDLATAIQIANTQFSQVESEVLERKIAGHAITEIFDNGVLPLAENVNSLHLLMPDNQKCQALSKSLLRMRHNMKVSCDSLASKNQQPHPKQFNSDILLVADVSPRQSMAELGGMDDLESWQERSDKDTQWDTIRAWMTQAKSQGAGVVFVSLRAPYTVADFQHLADAALASFAYRISHKEGKLYSPAMDALSEALLGVTPISGELPVSIELNSATILVE